MPTSLGPAEIMVVLLVALIVLGPARLPEAGRQVGRALAEMRRWSTRVQDEVRSTLDTEPEPMPPAPTPASPSGAVDTPSPVDLQSPEQHSAEQQPPA
jgi:sec-independent protein translocase protein TatA